MIGRQGERKKERRKERKKERKRGEHNSHFGKDHHIHIQKEANRFNQSRRTLPNNFKPGLAALLLKGPVAFFATKFQVSTLTTLANNLKPVGVRKVCFNAPSEDPLLQ